MAFSFDKKKTRKRNNGEKKNVNDCKLQANKKKKKLFSSFPY
jgi:hypothetical protein